MKSCIKTILVLIALLFVVNLTGCGPMLVRAFSTDKETYAKAVDDMEAIPSGQSRLTIYSSGGGPNVANPAGRMEIFLIDNVAYMIGGDTYFIIDVTSGDHEISFNTEMRWGFLGPKYKKGTDILKFKSPSGEEIFLKIKLKEATYSPFGKNNVIKFEVVSKEQAFEEISALKRFKEFKTYVKIED